MNNRSQYIIPLICVFSLNAASGAFADSLETEMAIANCVDSALTSIDVPNGMRGYDINAGEAWIRARGDHRLDEAGVESNIAKPLGYGVMTDYKYQVTLESEFFDYDRQLEIGASITFLFGAETSRNAIRPLDVHEGWGELSDDNRQDLEQLIRATETMALYFTVCMNMPLYENEKSGMVQPPAYFPAF